MANTYFEMLQAVENYYGSGSDQWVTMANWTGYQSTEVANILKQTPGVTVYTNEAGALVSYSVDGAATSMTAAEATAATAANAINSNALTEAAVQEAVTIPANVEAGSSAGTVAISSGATKLAAGGGKAATVLGHIGTGIVGAAVGMKLGVWIDAALYNSNPDFWGEAYNPETWKDYKIADWLYDYSGYDDFVCHFDKDGQLYVDEDLFALYAQYMANNNFFLTLGNEVSKDDVIASNFIDKSALPATVTYYHLPFTTTSKVSGNKITWSVKSSQSEVKFNIIAQAPNNNPNYFTWVSRDPFVIMVTDDHGYYREYESLEYTANDGQTYYYRAINDRNKYINWVPVNPTQQMSYSGDYHDFHSFAEDIRTLMALGETTQIGGHEGVNPYSQMPTGITPQMTVPEVIDTLKPQYPEIWENGIKQGTLNDDGTIKERVYVPVAVPTGGTEKQPTTDPEHPGPVDPTNEPQVRTVTKIIEKTPDPKPAEKDPDTGTGSTPVAPSPTGSADALYKIYNPTNAQIQSFGAWLWSSNFVDQLLKIFNDPMQAIISLHKIYATPHSGGTANIRVGYLDSGVSSKWVDEQYIDVDCGSVKLLEKTGSVYDYAPFVDVRIYLPFIGIVSVDVADVMRATIGVKYRIDVITGTLVAFVSVTRDSGAGGVIYQYTGSCCEAYPLSSGSYMGILTGVLGIAAGVAGTIATGGAAAPALLGGAAGLSAMHTKVEHSNGFSGNAGALACKKPYLIISRQQSALSNGISGKGGFPANSLIKLNQCNGFTKVRFIHLQSVKNATDFEHDEIIRLLTEGVII